LESSPISFSYASHLRLARNLNCQLLHNSVLVVAKGKTEAAYTYITTGLTCMLQADERSADFEVNK
jgi:hypothetical protein